MVTARVGAGLRTVGIMTALAAGMAFVAAVPAVAEEEPSLTTPVCGIDQPGSDEPWVAPPERRMPGKPY